MAEKDATARLRRAVKENNLFLVKRLVERTDMRNIDPSTRRYTSLAWAAVMGHEETFEFLLTAGHDDTELSRDSENNTILMLLADHRPPSNGYAAHEAEGSSGAAVRMARLYYDRHSDVLDWANAQGKTALHIAAIKGNEELVRMFCDLGADFDLPDNKGDTPLHYASAWGHLPVVQLLIERGCQYNSRNNEGFTASDYAYSYSTKDTLQDTARLIVENNKKHRKILLAQAAAERGNDWNGTSPIPMPLSNLPSRHRGVMPRMRSDSGTSRSTTTASDNGDFESNGLATGLSQSSFSASSSSQPSTGSNSYYHLPNLPPQMAAANSTLTVSGSSSINAGSTLSPPANSLSSLSPVASRVRERDADAIEKYLLRNRSGSHGTDNRSHNRSFFASAGPSANGDDITALNPVSNGGTSTPRRLRPSVSAVQLRTVYNAVHTIHTQPESRHRAGTGSSSQRSVSSNQPSLTRSLSTSTSPRSMNNGIGESETYIGPPSQYAQFPEPPLPNEETTTPIAQRRKAFHILSKPLPPFDVSVNHRRGMSANAVRGA